MMATFTKAEIHALHKEFFSDYRGDYPKRDWEHFITVKKAEQWQKDMNFLVAKGFIELFEDERGELRYAPTAKAAAITQAAEVQGVQS